MRLREWCPIMIRSLPSSHQLPLMYTTCKLRELSTPFRCSTKNSLFPSVRRQQANKHHGSPFLHGSTNVCRWNRTNLIQKLFFCPCQLRFHSCSTARSELQLPHNMQRICTYWLSWTTLDNLSMRPKPRQTGTESSLWYGIRKGKKLSVRWSHEVTR